MFPSQICDPLRAIIYHSLLSSAHSGSLSNDFAIWMLNNRIHLLFRSHTLPLWIRLYLHVSIFLVQLFLCNWYTMLSRLRTVRSMSLSSRRQPQVELQLVHDITHVCPTINKTMCSVYIRYIPYGICIVLVVHAVAYIYTLINKRWERCLCLIKQQAHGGLLVELVQSHDHYPQAQLRPDPPREVQAVDVPTRSGTWLPPQLPRRH